MPSNQSDILETIRSSTRKRFADELRLFSFEDYLEEVSTQPRKFLRSAVDWVCDAFRYFDQRGKVGENAIFQEHYADRYQPVFGHGEVQSRIRQVLEGFSKTGRSDKVLVLHGPNGSAKTTLCRNLFAALERYSRSPEGALYTFSWVFPLSKLSRSMGLASAVASQSGSYALWPTEDLGAILRSELHENPLFLIPKENRRDLLSAWMKKLNFNPADFEYLRSRFENSQLSHKNTLILETLLNEYHGDLFQLYKHIRVERFYLNYHLRSGLAVIEPQLGIDAHVRQVTLDQSLSNLPPSLQSLNLYQFEGDLVAGNRGVIEYSDLLKRPVESFKYLLSTSENSRIQVGPYASDLDSVFIATTNDLQLEAFREHPDFMSFRGRFEFIRVPYLLRYEDEEKIYNRELQSFKQVKELLPNTGRILALWAVMSRLKRPLTKNKSVSLTKILEGLSPMEKAKAYNSSEIPERFSEEERREFRNHLDELKTEHQSQAFYEGLLGPSPRELRVLIQAAALRPENKCLGPLSLIRELKAHIQRQADFEYLRLEPVGSYHDYALLVEQCYHEWIRLVDDEIRSVLGMGQLPKIRDILRSYIQRVMVLLRGEKIKNRITGKSEDPNTAEIELVERMFGVYDNLEEFRQSLIGRLGAWSVENKKTLSEALPFEEIFPDLVQKIRNSLKAEEDQKLAKMAEIIVRQDVADLAVKKDLQDPHLPEGERLAITAYLGLQREKNYGPLGALEAMGEYVKLRFRSEAQKS